jgi:hypothetical protein
MPLPPAIVAAAPQFMLIFGWSEGAGAQVGRSRVNFVSKYGIASKKPVRLHIGCICWMPPGETIEWRLRRTVKRSRWNGTIIVRVKKDMVASGPAMQKQRV